MNAAGDQMARVALPVAIARGRIIAVARGLNERTCRAAAELIAERGISAFEVTLDSPEALRTIGAIALHLSGDITVGAGTVLSVADARRAVDAGATFLVTPFTDTEITTWASPRDVPTILGALTPTEILTAWRTGASAVKVFPAAVGGAAYLASIRAPLAQVPLIPTGGVTDINIAAYLDAGAAAVGSSWLCADGDMDEIPGRAQSMATAARAQFNGAP